MKNRVGNTAASLRLVESNVTVSLPEEFGFEMANCSHMHRLALGAIDSLAVHPSFENNPHFHLAHFAFYEAKRRFDELYGQFVDADPSGRAAGIHCTID